MNRKRTWLGAALLLALMGATGFLLLREQPVARLAAVLGQVKPLYVLAGLGLMLLFIGCEALCSRLILSRLGHRAPYRRCLGYSFTGFYFSSITPSSTGGQPAQIYYMSRDGIPAAHGTLNMMLIAVCYQVVVLLYALGVVLFRFDLLANLGGGLALLLLFGGAVNLARTGGMLCLMFLPGAARALTGWVLNLLERLHLVRNRPAAEEKLEHQMQEYRRGADCVKANPGLIPILAGVTAVQLTALFSVPFVVYRAFGLSGYSAADIICTQALVTLAVSSLPLPGAVGASEGGFVKAMTLFFGSALVTPAVLLSRGISFYSFLLISAGVTLWVHFRTSRPAQAAQPVIVTPKKPKRVRGTVTSW